MWHWLLFHLKWFCDVQLYGDILLPPKTCIQCGYSILAGQETTARKHLACN